MGLFGKKTKEREKNVVKETIDESVRDDMPQEAQEEKKETATSAPATTASSVLSVLVGPHVTEKSHALATQGQYVFVVQTSATKRAVKRAIEQEYDVHVTAIQMTKIPKKRRTVKYNRGYQKVGKKAIVRVADGESIALFETA